MPETTTTKDVDHLLAVYLRDHFAGAAAGVALAERCRRSNEDNPLGAVLAEIAAEISTDRDSLRDIMKRLNVSEDALKAMLGQAGELVARLKTNGVLTHYSPSSRVIELEGLLAGIDAKRNLWRSLRTAAATRPELDTAALGELIGRATSATRPPPGRTRTSGRHRVQPGLSSRDPHRSARCQRVVRVAGPPGTRVVHRQRLAADRRSARSRPLRLVAPGLSGG